MRLRARPAAPALSATRPPSVRLSLCPSAGAPSRCADSRLSNQMRSPVAHFEFWPKICCFNLAPFSALRHFPCATRPACSGRQGVWVLLETEKPGPPSLPATVSDSRPGRGSRGRSILPCSLLAGSAQHTTALTAVCACASFGRPAPRSPASRALQIIHVSGVCISHYNQRSGNAQKTFPIL